MTSKQYNELRDISRRKFNENGDDILHDLILKFPNDFEKIKAYLLTQNYLYFKYEFTEQRTQREHELFRSEKQCACCKEIKKACEFYVLNKPTGKELHSYCKECSNKKSKEYRDKNRDKINEKARKYRAKNKDIMYARTRRWNAENRDYKIEYSRKYYAKNKAIFSEKSKEYYQKNKERIKKKKAEWRIKNKEKIKEYKREYRLRIKQKLKKMI